MSAIGFRKLHESFLVIPNAWDAVSARLFENAGAKAIATSSCALAWSLGYADGEALPMNLLIDSVRRMTRVVRVPVSVDFERGYSDDPDQVVRNVERLVDAGAVGVNLEDACEPVEVLQLKIEALRARFTRDELFINARTCLVLKQKMKHLDEVTERGSSYANAGADGFFVPRLGADQLPTVAKSTSLPVNVFPMNDARKLGARRVSLGPFLAYAALQAAEDQCRAVLNENFTLPPSTMTVSGLNALMTDFPLPDGGEVDEVPRGKTAASR